VAGGRGCPAAASVAEKHAAISKPKSIAIVPEKFFNRDHDRDQKLKNADRFCRKNRRPFFRKKSRSDDEKLTIRAHIPWHAPRRQQHPRAAVSIAIRFL